MRFKLDPRQNRLFDPYAPVFSDVAYRFIERSWYAVFREVILALMPVEEIGSHFSAAIGRPTKELYSMAGLIFIMEFMNWTVPEAVRAYMFDSAVQYALNLEPAKQTLGAATVERYQRLFREDRLSRRIFDDVVVKLVEELDLNVSRQRLDSTHVASDMATFGRTRLMVVTIKRFLTQVKRHDAEGYEALPERFRERYAETEKKLFKGADREGRKRLRQECAEDMLFLIERFADDPKHKERTTYEMLRRVFEEQCEVEAGKVIVKKKTGGNVIQNPSDPDATYDGKKGPGYQVQVCETCSEDNEVQLILSAGAETAVKSDQDAVEPVLDDLDDKGLLPEILEADTGYGRDANCAAAEARGVDLQSPVCGNEADNDDPFKQLSVDDFVVDPATEEVIRCPAGHQPLSSTYDPEKDMTTTVMPNEACAGCEFGGECPTRKSCGKFRLEHSPKQRRLEERRREQATPAFAEHYARRAGIEGTNSSLKRKTGMGRLRVRGLKALAHSVILKLAGWNVLRAAASAKLREKLEARRAAVSAQTRPISWIAVTIGRSASRGLRRLIRGSRNLIAGGTNRRPAIRMRGSRLSRVAA